MDNVSLMKILHCQENLADYDRAFNIIQSAAFILDEGEQVSCRDELLEKVSI